MSASQDSRKRARTSLPPQHHYVVISSDSHAGADLLDYKPYLESKWHDEFDAWAASYSNPWDFVDPRLEKPGFDFGETEVLTGAASWHSALSWDSPRRLLHMDEDGVSAEVVFPNTAQPFLSGSAFAGTGPADRADYERRQAGAARPQPLAGRLLRPGTGPPRRNRAGNAADADNAVRGGRADQGDGPDRRHPPADGQPDQRLLPLYVSDLEPLWQLCADLDMPIHKHAPAPPAMPAADRSGPGVIAISFAENHFYNRRGVAHLIFSGVLERHPTLKVILTEGGANWIPEHLEQLDRILFRRQGRTRLPALPQPGGAAALADPQSVLPPELLRRREPVPAQRGAAPL